ncbi:hypothetical protein AAZX31_01G039500 [Glycine max]|nr:hypothetical protein GmHk_01G000390 [Glycine max]
MTSSSINAIVYYDGAIITTKHGSTFVSSLPKIIQVDNKMSFDALKQVIGNNISLPNGKVVKYIHFRLLDYLYHLLVIVASTGHACCKMMRTYDYVFYLRQNLQAHMLGVIYCHQRHTHTNMCTSTTNLCQLFEFGGFG